LRIGIGERRVVAGIAATPFAMAIFAGNFVVSRHGATAGEHYGRLDIGVDEGGLAAGIPGPTRYRQEFTQKTSSSGTI